MKQFLATCPTILQLKQRGIWQLFRLWLKDLGQNVQKNGCPRLHPLKLLKADCFSIDGGLKYCC